MRHRRRTVSKWISIAIVYVCIFLLSYEYGTNRRHRRINKATVEPRNLVMKRLFYDHGEYLNASMILKMIKDEFKYPLSFSIQNTTKSVKTIRHGLIVFYDFANHHVLFQQFLWLYSSWIQLSSDGHTQNDLIVFISSPTIPNDFKKLKNSAKMNQKHLIIYPCETLIDSILNQNYDSMHHFSIHFHLELVRLFYWQQARLSSLSLFLMDKYKTKLLTYDYIFRLDVDSFLMPNFHLYQQTSLLTLGESIPYDQYTLNRLERIKEYFSLKRKLKILKYAITICWFGQLNLISQLARRVILMAVWLIKVEFTESERLHHLTYLNYPSWYIDGIFEYATTLVLSLNSYEKINTNMIYRFDCHHSLRNCLHISLRDPSHHLHLSKHSLRLLTYINQTNLTDAELYVYRTVLKSNGMFQLYFS